MRGRVIAVCAVVCVALAAGAAPVIARRASLEPPAQPISWLTIGDSYSAGEGATASTGYCQRSPNAAGPKAATILRNERDWAITPEVNAACTGYLAADVYTSRNALAAAGHNSFGVATGFDAASEVSGDSTLHDWAVTQAPAGQKFDVIVVSLGGNDIGFADVVYDCIDYPLRVDSWAAWITRAPTGCSQSLWAPDGLRARVDAVVNDNPNDGFAAPAVTRGGAQLGSLRQLYQDLADDLLAPTGKMIIMGYPRLVTPPQDWGAWRGNRCNMISKADAGKLGELAAYFDQQLQTMVAGMDSRFSYVSRLSIFDDGGRYHSLCGRGVEWINTPLVFLRDGSLRPQHGFHPNDLGYLATAESVAGIVENFFGVAPAPIVTATPPVEPPVVTPAPTVRSAEAHFDVGEPFAARCQIAWPTAPSRGVDSISMMMSCSGVPSQFLLTNVVYPDPDLAVTPSNSKLDVFGTIVDIVRSEYGYTILQVLADRVEFVN